MLASGPYQLTLGDTVFRAVTVTDMRSALRFSRKTPALSGAALNFPETQKKGPPRGQPKQIEDTG